MLPPPWGYRRQPASAWLKQPFPWPAHPSFGCTESLLRATHPTLETLLLDMISLDYHDTLCVGTARQSGVGVLVEEAAVPVKGAVRGACELLGLDALNVANEGKLIAISAAPEAERLLAVMRAHPLGRDAAIIGRIVEDDRCFVHMETTFGGGRMVDWLAGEQLPRIC